MIRLCRLSLEWDLREVVVSYYIWRFTCLTAFPMC